MTKFQLNDYEMQLVRYFAQHFTEKDRYAAFVEMPGYEDRRKFGEAFGRLIRFEFVKAHSTSSLEILPSCLEAVEDWDHPPLPDRWDEATKWFRSKRWSLPVLVLAVGLPALKSWVDGIKMLLEWMAQGGK